MLLVLLFSVSDVPEHLKYTLTYPHTAELTTSTKAGAVGDVVRLGDSSFLLVELMRTIGEISYGQIMLNSLQELSHDPVLYFGKWFASPPMCSRSNMLL